MKAIYKYPLVWGGTRVKLHESFKVLKLATQRGAPTLWCEVDTGTFNIEIDIKMFATGESLPKDLVEWTYVDSLLMLEDSLVWHFYWRYAID